MKEIYNKQIMKKKFKYFYKLDRIKIEDSEILVKDEDIKER